MHGQGRWFGNTMSESYIKICVLSYSLTCALYLVFSAHNVEMVFLEDSIHQSFI